MYTLCHLSTLELLLQSQLLLCCGTAAQGEALCEANAPCLPVLLDLLLLLHLLLLLVLLK